MTSEVALENDSFVIKIAGPPSRMVFLQRSKVHGQYFKIVDQLFVVPLYERALHGQQHPFGRPVKYAVRIEQTRAVYVVITNQWVVNNY